MKARLVLHGNRYRDQYSVRRDPSSEDLSVIRLVFSLTTLLGFDLVTVDVRGAYMQSGPIQRELYFRPLKNVDLHRQVAWKLLRLPFGIIEAGRQWLCAIEDWMLQEFGAERTYGVEQLFHNR